MILEEDILKYSEAVERIMNNKELSLSEKSCLTYLLLLETEISVKGIAAYCDNTIDEVSEVLLSLEKKRYIDIILNFKNNSKIKILKIWINGVDWKWKIKSKY